MVCNIKKRWFSSFFLSFYHFAILVSQKMPFYKKIGTEGIYLIKHRLA